MVAKFNQYIRWDFLGLSTDTKPTPATSEDVTDGSTYYEVDTSKLYVYYKDNWYEKESTGGGGGGGGDSNANLVYVKYDNANNRYDLTTTGDNNKNLCKIMTDYINGKEDFLITFGMKRGEKESYCIATEMKVDVFADYVSFYIITVADRPDLSTGTSKYGMDYRDITPKHVTLYAPKSEYTAGKIEHLYSDTSLTHQYFTLEGEGRTLYGLWTNSSSKMPLAANNTASFTPTGDYNPATKKYVDDNIGVVALPIDFNENTGTMVTTVTCTQVKNQISAGKIFIPKVTLTDGSLVEGGVVIAQMDSEGGGFIVIFIFNGDTEQFQLITLTAATDSSVFSGSLPS